MSETSKKHRAEAPNKLRFAVFTCSTSRYQMLKKNQKVSDVSADLIVESLKKAGHALALREVVADDPVLIGDGVQKVLDSAAVDAAIFCGGTGIAPSDVTIEAVSSYLHKTLPGFGEIFRRLSYDRIGSAAVLSRALAGVAGSKVVFCIPGSPDAVRTCLDKLILPEVGHIVKHARELSGQGSEATKK